MKISSIKELSLDNKKSLEQIALKLTEETGEVAQALLSNVGASGSEYKNLNADDVKEECVDVIMVVLSLFYKLGGEDQELESVFDDKVEKWKEKTDWINKIQHGKEVN